MFQNIWTTGGQEDLTDETRNITDFKYIIIKKDNKLTEIVSFIDKIRLTQDGQMLV